MRRQPNLRPVPNGNKYELLRDYGTTVDLVDIVVPRFFRYDGASIPPIAWQIIYSPFHPDVMLPALVHDWLYYNHQTDREQADDIFYYLLKDNGVDDYKCSTMWQAVKVGGEYAWENDEDDINYLLKLREKVKDRPNFNRYVFPPEVLERVNQ